jgi:hypothetical protein
MAGFVIDIWIGFLVRWGILFWRNPESRNWPTVSGAIVRCHFETHGYGGDYVVLDYKYKVEVERFQGSLHKPYIYPNYAAAFVRHHLPESNLRIRVNPKDPNRSFPVFN